MSQQLVIFEMSSKQMALKASVVMEIVRAVEFTSLPELPTPLMGVVNYRGKLVPVAQMSRLLNLEESLPLVNQHFIIVGSEDQPKVCLLVDKVTAFISPDEIQTIGHQESGNCSITLTPELARVGSSVIPVLAIEGLLNEGVQISLAPNLEEKSPNGKSFSLN
ncbi:MAG TPA: chemotaxis protein CheW [Chloroflexia bacterium]|nr:chemotaxis protein CheW [Chloroflexia bacterium]